MLLCVWQEDTKWMKGAKGEFFLELTCCCLIPPTPPPPPLHPLPLRLFVFDIYLQCVVPEAAYFVWFSTGGHFLTSHMYFL
jgi:hypothetical protein